ncbi:MAG: ECF transporter S component [Longicatena sp.]|nr:ECF transporter S component [Longicatena sp.]
MKLTTKKISVIAMLSAMAMIVSLLFYIPIVPAVSFLKYEAKDVLVTICGFIYGPMAALFSSSVTAVLEMFLRGGNIIDVIMDIISTGSFACVAAYMYKKQCTQKGAVLGLFLGSVLMVVLMMVWNYVVTPIYYNMPREAVVALMIPGFLPFNAIKAILNTLLIMLLYKPIVRILRNTSLLEKSDKETKVSTGYILIILFLLLTVGLVLLSFKGMI